MASKSTPALWYNCHSCSYCEKLVALSLRKQYHPRNLFIDIITYSGSKAEEAASNGYLFFRSCISLLEKKLEENDIQLTGLRWKAEEATRWTLHMSTALSESLQDSDLNPPRLGWQVRMDDSKSHTIRIGRLDVLTQEEDPAAAYIHARPMYKVLKSEDHFTQACSAMQHCEQQHAGCRIDKSLRMPSLLVQFKRGDAVDSWKISLIKPRMRTSYAALSYCWGLRAQPLQAIVANQTSLFDDIPFMDLAKIIQDVIVVARGIGLDLLWVDSLCIVQDDTKSKQMKLSKMVNIYRGAFITISAARATSCLDGFLDDLALPRVNSDAYIMKYVGPDGLLDSITLFNMAEDPVDYRAWTLEEYLLSSRVLRYGARGVKLICRNSTSKVTDIDGTVSPYEHFSETRSAMLRHFFATSARFPRIRWMGIVDEYTSRNLGTLDDRLIAIAGLAEARASVHGGVYLAGHWLDELPRSLLWHRDEAVNPKPRSRRAPTWSWASLDVSITALGHFGQDCQQTKVHECQVLPALESALYGKVRTGGWIKIEGLVHKAKFNDNHLVPFARDQMPLDDRRAIKSYDAIITMDVDVQSYAEVSCLQIRPFKDKVDGGPLGLILLKKNDGRFERVGLFDLSPEVYTDRDTSARVIQQGEGWTQYCTLETLIIV